MARYKQLVIFSPALVPGAGGSGSGTDGMTWQVGSVLLFFEPGPYATVEPIPQVLIDAGIYGSATAGYRCPFTWDGLRTAIQTALVQLALDDELTVDPVATVPAPAGSGTGPWTRITIRTKDFANNYAFNAPSFFGYYGSWAWKTILPAIAGPQVTADVLACACYGCASGGSILLSVAGGVAPYSYAWTDGTTTKDRLNVGLGTYSVTVSDQAPATPYVITNVNPGQADFQISGGEVQGVTVQQFTITQPPEPQVSISRNDGLVTVNVTGGTLPWTFLWSDGSTLPTRNNLAPGTYTVTLTDGAGCQSTISVVIPPFERYFSRNPITLRTDAGDAYRADNTTKPGLTFRCEVWIERTYRSGTFELVGTAIEQPADRLGRTIFQVQELLDPFLDEFVPALTQRGIVRATPLFRRFFLKFAEVFGDPPAAAPTTTITQHVVSRGGLGFLESRLRTWFDTFQERRGAFLTWQPLRKLARRDQPEYLSWQALEEYSTIRLWRRAYRANGSSESKMVGTYAGINRYEIFCAATGWESLQLDKVSGQRVTAWEVWITDNTDNRISEVRRYELDERPRWQVRYLLFVNSLGGVDTLVATGRGELEVTVGGEDLALALPVDYDVQDGDTAVLDRVLTPVYKLATGLRSREEALTLQDFILSRRVLLVEGGRLLAGTVRLKSAGLADDAAPRKGIEFEFLLPRERSYTPVLPDTPVPVDVIDPNIPADE